MLAVYRCSKEGGEMRSTYEILDDVCLDCMDCIIIPTNCDKCIIKRLKNINKDINQDKKETKQREEK